MESDRQEKKVLIKELIQELHRGLSVEDAKDRFEREVGTISSSEIAEIEQSLMDDEGMSPDEIKRFCNVHALLFESALGSTRDPLQEVNPAHPVHLFRLENDALLEITGTIREALDSAKGDPPKGTERIGKLLDDLAAVEIHYARKEQVLFPYLERYGFMGPTTVMWGKDDEVRDLLKAARSGVRAIESPEDLGAFAKDTLIPLLDEAEGMVQKEEDILLPTALDKLSTEDWASVLLESEDVGYAFIEPPAEVSRLAAQLQSAVTEEVYLSEDEIVFPSGSLSPRDLMALIGALPVELTFVGPDRKVKYFSEGRDRIFVRTKAIIGREVKHCHPPGSTHLVDEILRDFEGGKRSEAEFWLEIGDRFIHIDFRALHDEGGEYLGVLEIAQDATHLRGLTGEKRLLDE